MSFSENIFAKNGKIAKNLSGYEVRSGQIRMAETIEEAIASSKNLIVEAGPGIGKSLAYLVPFINWAYRENKKVIVSTYTKPLQSQLYIKDLPFLKRALGIDFRYVLCMGSDNYACLRKVYRPSKRNLFTPLENPPYGRGFLTGFTTKGKKRQAERIMEWLETTETGLVQDMDFTPDKSVWERFSREYETCAGRRCRHYDECFYKKMREKQSKAHILITNHSLLFTNIIRGASVLPEIDALVLDEAHTLEDAATNHFTKTVNSAVVQYLVSEAGGLFLPGGASADEIKCRAKELKTASKRFFARVEEIFGRDEKTVQFESDQFPVAELLDAIEKLSKNLSELDHDFEKYEMFDEINSFLQKCEKLTESINFIFSQSNAKYVYWLDVEPKKNETVYIFNAAPIDVSSEMRKCLFEVISPIVLTSATLSMPGVESDFSFIKSRLGINDALELVVNSPYDYANNVLMYLAESFADPNRDPDAFLKQVWEDITRVYDIMGGRIFVLFTSFDMLNRTAEKISEKRNDINILKQGQMPRYVLLDVFKRNKQSILMGTTTFWQGVDVPGSSLECVIITKLPFAVPTDPVTAARIKLLEEEGRNAFTEYQVPKAVMMFKQGFGRLIRSHTDRGVIAVLDPRIKTRYYGRTFLNALPECRKTSDIQDIAKFFK